MSARIGWASLVVAIIGVLVALGAWLYPVDATLPTPTLVSPSDGSVFKHYPRSTTLMWDPVPGAARYYYEVEFYNVLADRWDPQWGEQNTTVGTNHNFDFVGSQPGRWRVTAITANGTAGKSSEWWHFTYLSITK